MEVVHRIPFLKLLLPLLIGIILQYYIDIYRWSMIPISIGCGIILLSYIVTAKHQHYHRYLFGVGVSLCLIGIGTVSTGLRQEASLFTFPDISQVYDAVITDIPQEKPYTINLKVELSDTRKQVVCYLPKNKLSKGLRAGDHISFFGKISKFESSRDSDGFDYAAFMRNKGYAGVIFVKNGEWQQNESSSSGIKIWSSRCRQAVLKYYHSLDLSEAEFGILSALSLGYTDSLSDDLVQSFRATGTAHLLAISGMHMILFYSVIFFITGLVLYQSRFRSARYVLVIVLLWIYLFVIGFPASAVRAGIALTFLCAAKIRGVQLYSFNTFFACAFIMLVWNPLWLFDIGFQLSFSAVLAMLVFLPLLPDFVHKGNKIFRYFINIAVISVVVQIGTLPLCLYYFGVFPSYFIITNLLIIPLFTLAVYIALCIIGVSVFALLSPLAADYLLYIPIESFKMVIKVLTTICCFFEQLPLALQDGLRINLISVFLIWTGVSAFVFFVKYNKPRLLIYGISILLIFLIMNIYDMVQYKDSLTVRYNRGQPSVQYSIGFTGINHTGFTSNHIINLKGQLYLVLVDDGWKNTRPSDSRMDIDYLHIVHGNDVSMSVVSAIFNIKKVILDGTLSDYHSKRLALECEKLRIPYHQVSDDGALRIFF